MAIEFRICCGRLCVDVSGRLIYLASWILPNSHAFLNICRTDPLTELNHKFGYLLDVDNIFALLRILLVLYNLRTPCNL